MKQRKNDIVILLYRESMTNKVNVGALVEKDYAKAFHTRCIDNNTTMSAVIKNAIDEYMKTHPMTIGSLNRREE